MPGTPPRRPRAVGLGWGRRRSAGRTFTLTLPQGRTAIASSPWGPCRDCTPNPGQGPSPHVSHSRREAQVCTRPASLEAWALAESQPHPHGFAELVVTRDPQTVPLSSPAACPPSAPGSLPCWSTQGPALPQDPQGQPTAHPQYTQPRGSCAHLRPRSPRPLSLSAVLSAWEGVG